MPKEFKINRYNENPSNHLAGIIDEDSGYTLVLNGPHLFLQNYGDGRFKESLKVLYEPFQRVFFSRLYFGNPYTDSQTITARELYEYGAGFDESFRVKRSDFFIKMKIKPRHQYVEVGSGLGGLILHIVEKQKSTSPKPIVIDPANYPLMQEMLDYALTQEEFSEFRPIFLKLQERTELYLSKKIELFNTTLEDALEKNPELQEIADVVIDNMGPFIYPGNEENKHFYKEDKENQIIALEKQLLKYSGKLYVNGNSVMTFTK